VTSSWPGPVASSFTQAIDQEDTNWIVILKDVGPDPFRQDGQTPVKRTFPTTSQKEKSPGAGSRPRIGPWTKPGPSPEGPGTRLPARAQKPVVPGEITEYDIEILATANMFKAGHRICVEITSMEHTHGRQRCHEYRYIPYHICSGRTDGAS